MITRPIWVDTFYETSQSELSYRISLDGGVVFSGKAYRYPNADILRININKVCQNYLSNNSVETIFNGAQTENAPESIRTFVLMDDSGRTLETYRFLYDWSYEDKDWIGGNVILSKPINGHYTDGMIRLNTLFSDGRVINYGYNNAYRKNIRCQRYALYYLNAFGGWDSFLIEGNVNKSDKINPYNFNTSFDNQTREFEQGRYVAEIDTEYVMHTGYLSDDGAYTLAKNLIPSNRVYLHDILEGTIKPVVITNTTSEYKTYKNQGERMVNYTLNIKESQSKIRY